MLPIDTSLLPPEVRAAGPKGQQLYAAALQFENLLIGQITQHMFDASQALNEGEDGQQNPYQAMMPSSLADSITQGGGLGLAPELYRLLSQSLGGTQPQQAGGEPE